MKMKENQIKKICSFYVNEWHLTTMMLPYINKRIEKGIFISTLLEKEIQEKVQELVEKMNLKPETKKQVLQINWKNNSITDTKKIEQEWEKQLQNHNEIEIIATGDQKRFQKLDAVLERIMEKEEFAKKKATIVHCYDITTLDNREEQLKEHHSILNTAGLHTMIEDVLEPKKFTQMKQVAN